VVTDVNEYCEALEEWAPELTRHLPNPVPAYARHVRFSLRRGAWRSGSHLQLRFTLSGSQLKTVAATTGGDILLSGTRRPARPDCERMPMFYAGDSEGWRPFPSEYSLHELSLKAEKGRCWHGVSTGIATSERRSEVVYWAERW
jgi:hypothetical protein